MKRLNKYFVISIFMFISTAFAAETQLKSGDFVGFDSGHHGEGSVVLVQDGDQQTLKFVNHFYVTPGPDLYVWLIKNSNPKTAQDVKDSPNVQLAKLKTPSGNQSYKIPAYIDMNQYGSVVIWCLEFGVLFAHAPLK
ncbi:MAG: hypothetical protein COB24_08135 [Hyphomicrobiales bacterium]|nr:MAG: hypothetical protein COB24_08135 [Hyphomicrobiales bacterium]